MSSDGDWSASGCWRNSFSALPETLDLMPITIQDYAEQEIEAVRRFNERLAAGGLAMRFPLSPAPAWLPKIVGRKIFQEYYLAVDDAAEVRGAYILKHQDFWIRDRVLSIADFHLPISEGAVDKNYPQVAVRLLRHGLARQPLLFGLGIGGYGEPLTKLLAAARWSMFSVPFFFRVLHPRAFLRNLQYLRRRAAGRLLLNTGKWTGLGWLCIRGVQAVAGRMAPRDPTLAFEPVDEFSDWADDLWRRHKTQYGMSAVRDAETLRILYPKGDARFLRLRVSQRSQPIGWAVLVNARLSNHNYFGNMRLGSIVDCFAAVEDAGKVVAAARDFLATQGADLVVSNQSHAAWADGLRRAGFLRGPSNFIFASSPALTVLLRQNGVKNEDLHFNRGDGDGPINLS
jgi:hypothetical protein